MTRRYTSFSPCTLAGDCQPRRAFKRYHSYYIQYHGLLPDRRRSLCCICDAICTLSNIRFPEIKSENKILIRSRRFLVHKASTSGPRPTSIPMAVLSIHSTDVPCRSASLSECLTRGDPQRKPITKSLDKSHASRRQCQVPVKHASRTSVFWGA